MARLNLPSQEGLSFLLIRLFDQGKDVIQLVRIFDSQLVNAISMMADIGNVPGEFIGVFQFAFGKVDPEFQALFLQSDIREIRIVDSEGDIKLVGLDSNVSQIENFFSEAVVNVLHLFRNGLQSVLLRINYDFLADGIYGAVFRRNRFTLLNKLRDNFIPLKVEEYYAFRITHEFSMAKVSAYLNNLEKIQWYVHPKCALRSMVG